MRGIAFSALGLAVITTLVMFIGVTFTQLRNAIPIERSTLGGRIEAARLHILWEYKNNPQFPTKIDVNMGCAPMIVLDTEDPIWEFAVPYITYVCGG